VQAPAQVRDKLASALALDLVGPAPDDAAHAEEVLPTAPSVWYLTGFLVPFEAPPGEREGDDADGELDEIGKARAGDDEAAPEATAARKGLFPSSIGLSLLVPAAARSLSVTACWGDYSPLPLEEADLEHHRAPRWVRRPRVETVELPLHEGHSAELIANSGGLELVLSVRAAPSGTGLLPGTRSVSVFLVNRRPPVEGAREQAWVFQAGLRVKSAVPLVARPDVRSSTDWDDRVTDLQYRGVVEHAVGHNVSVRVHCDEQKNCHDVETTWMPRAEVEKVVATAIPGVDLGMEAIAAAASGAVLKDTLTPMLDAYTIWLKGQITDTLTGLREETRDDLLHRAALARDRITAGLTALARDPDAFFAFQLANRAVATAMRQRACHGNDRRPEQIDAPRWRPFQLAFILLNLPGIVDPTHGDRRVVDLLFFPTGGGKTEAYLGLAAFTLVLRRLRDPGLLGRRRRADALHPAPPHPRSARPRRHADLRARARAPARPAAPRPWPFEIGLWVGQAATPNEHGQKGDSRPTTARARVLAYQGNDPAQPLADPARELPVVRQVRRDSFKPAPEPRARASCDPLCGRDCLFTRNQALPLVAVDEPLYRRLPCFIIATVDKFAEPALGRRDRGLARRRRPPRREGFYGPAEPGEGRRCCAPCSRRPT
jgi:hypothetical protein